MHSHFVAHLDIGFHDVLISFGGLQGRTEYINAMNMPAPFRSLLSAPCRYTFIDFEVSVIFPYGLDTKKHRSSGVPLMVDKRILEPTQYGKVRDRCFGNIPTMLIMLYIFSPCHLNGSQRPIIVYTKVMSTK